MLIFIRLIPYSIKEKDLRWFVLNALCSPWRRLLRRWGNIRSVRIIKITDQGTLSIEYHGLVNVEPARLADAAIKKLNHTELGGRSVQVRKFQKRSGYRDRRGQDPGMEGLAIHNRRQKDRRRDSLSTEGVRVAGEYFPGEILSYTAHQGVSE